MTEGAGLLAGGRGDRLFTWVKYLTYSLLSINVLLFLQEELLALEHTFVHGVALGQIIQVFAATIDTGAWVILLLLFELETSVLDDRKIRGPVKLALHGIRGICYVAVVYAFSGYCAELLTLLDASLLPGFDPCAVADQGMSLLVDIDEYLPLDASTCQTAGAEFWRLNGFDIVAATDRLQAARYLAWVDVINAATWILVVVVLEIEVRLQLRGDLSDYIMNLTKYVKFTLYSILFLAAGYWGVAGDFLDFWDAFLWLFAFIFIELNVFEWQSETSHDETGQPETSQSGTAA